MSKFLYKTR